MRQEDVATRDEASSAHVDEVSRVREIAPAPQGPRPPAQTEPTTEVTADLGGVVPGVPSSTPEPQANTEPTNGEPVHPDVPDLGGTIIEVFRPRALRASEAAPSTRKD